MHLIYLLCLSTSFLGCLSDPGTKPASTSTPSSQISSTPSLLVTTKLPAITNIPTVNYTPSNLLAMSTLETGEAYLLLRQFLNNDPPCQLPCWGEVTPGISTAVDAEKSFRRLSGISSPEITFFGTVGASSSIGNLSINYPREDTMMYLWQGFLAKDTNETVLLLEVDARSLAQTSNDGNFSYQKYNDLLSAYTLSEIFTTYGVPNLIFFRADINLAEPHVSDFFIIRLLYLDIGIFINYTMLMETKEDTFRFCPSESLINLELTPRNIGDDYQEFFRKIGDEEWASIPYKTRDQSIENSLGLTNEEFYRVIISSPNTCFESPKSIWSQP